MWVFNKSWFFGKDGQRIFFQRRKLKRENKHKEKMLNPLLSSFLQGRGKSVSNSQFFLSLNEWIFHHITTCDRKALNYIIV